MVKRLARAYLSPSAKRRLKAKASLAGMSLSDYLDKISQEFEKEDKRTEKRYGGGFF